jgi:hypothetical protein
MGGERASARTRDRIVGARLRAIRKEQTDLTLEAAAELAQWSLSTMSRIETGNRQISTADVATLCVIYRLPLAQRERLIESARTGNPLTSGDGMIAGAPAEMSTLASYESDAIRLTDCSMAIVPGLLQTRDYAIGLMSTGRTDFGEPDARWQRRERRQQVLGAVDYTAFVGEAALRTSFGGEEALRTQLRHLRSASDRGICLRVVPEHSVSSAVAYSWHLMEFRRASPVVNVELVKGAVYLYDTDAEAYLPEVQRLDRLALSSADSRSLLERLAAGR